MLRNFQLFFQGNVAEKFYLDKPDSSGASGVDSVLVSTDASLVIMLRHGILALQLMPEDSVSGEL